MIIIIFVLNKFFLFFFSVAPVCKGIASIDSGAETDLSSSTSYPVNLVCRMDASPSNNLTFHWKFSRDNDNDDNDDDAVPYQRFTSHGTTSTLNYSTDNVDFDNATVACHATNQLGATARPCFYKIFISQLLYKQIIIIN